MIVVDDRAQVPFLISCSRSFSLLLWRIAVLTGTVCRASKPLVWLCGARGPSLRGPQQLLVGFRFWFPLLSELLKRGVYHDYALTTGCARKGAWRMSSVKWVHIALPDSYFRSLGRVFPWLDSA